MQSHPSFGKKALSPLITTAFLTYLLLFSCVALYHAYAENEILDAHECAVGLWVEQGHAALTFFVALSLFLCLVAKNIVRLYFFVAIPAFFQQVPRGPPFQPRFS